jgi:hypothetical protein
MENIGISAKCPCCGSKDTVREDVDAFDEGWNIVVSIYNVCRDCNADFLEEIVYKTPSKYTIVPADEVDE